MVENVPHKVLADCLLLALAVSVSQDRHRTVDIWCAHFPDTVAWLLTEATRKPLLDTLLATTQHDT